MKSQLKQIDNHGVKYQALQFVCPGCVAGAGREGYDGIHMLPVNAEGIDVTSWTWNGDLENPTLEPSILSHAGSWLPRCHSYLRNGVFEFLSDSTHPLVGQHVPMPDLPDWATQEAP